MYISLMRLRRSISPDDIAELSGTDGYQIHKLIWKIFSDGPARKRDFLYRYESARGWPTFYTVSERKPVDPNNVWDIRTKRYEPRILKGAKLSFMVRVNPVRSKRDDHGCQHRHDVIMEAKKRIGFKELPQDKRPHVATLVHESGMSWLKAREGEYGFCVKDDKENPSVRADGYYQHKLYKGKGAFPIAFSTLDFTGVLTVADKDVFVEKCLFGGIGPAKGFGCGLMLVKRFP